MRISKTAACWSLFFLFATSCSLWAQARSPQDIQKSCQDFVQRFYDWYAAKTRKEGVGPSWALALKYRPSKFTPEIVRRLREDSGAQAKVSGEIVGLDFDPFLNSQDPGERYVVGNITPKDDRYWVEVYGIWSGKKSEEPVVVPELIFRDGRWLFVNFHYGKGEYVEHENLLSILKGLRERRQKQAK